MLVCGCYMPALKAEALGRVESIRQAKLETNAVQTTQLWHENKRAGQHVPATVYHVVACNSTEPAVETENRVPPCGGSIHL
jgi:hypothetical protein